MALIDMSETYQMTNPGAHIDATDVYNSNDNLLDNAYFVGGGSQLGDGVFPINQRGQTSYSAYTNSIDRWYAAAAMTIAADGISCGVIVQKLPQVANLNGKTLTFSALLADGTMLSGYAVFNSASDTYFYRDAGASEFLMYNTYFGGFEVATQRKIAAVKLEVGTVSTLANDVPPNFGEELRKCKRYLRYVPLTRTPAVIGGNTAIVTLNGIEMAGVPTPALIYAGGARDAGGEQNITSATVTSLTYNTPTVQFALSGNLNSVIGYVYDTVVRLSCEL